MLAVKPYKFVQNMISLLNMCGQNSYDVSLMRMQLLESPFHIENLESFLIRPQYPDNFDRRKCEPKRRRCQHSMENNPNFGLLGFADEFACSENSKKLKKKATKRAPSIVHRSSIT
ncbi:hypothetical protein Y032_0019g3736 [Ancylostoma ceylanicum]|uniref:Uncharacterized protein n=1 Tax=Ancylostoma ceylanicum TaxID=53326 RepID=A0A016V3I2_9BILA|nr:hypothetical protein Y032_0019g3736 [Ancylostoma ceylanicum]